MILLPFVNPVVFVDYVDVLITVPAEAEEDAEEEPPIIWLSTLLIVVVVITGSISDPFKMELIKSWASWVAVEDELLVVTVLVVWLDDDEIGWFS